MNNPEQKTRLQREIEATDREIDQLVYELYTEEVQGQACLFAIRQF